jgi:hypothetical protein
MGILIQMQSLQQPRFDPWSYCVGLVMDYVVLGQVFFKHFGFPYQLFQLIHIHYSSHHLMLQSLNTDNIAKQPIE